MRSLDANLLLYAFAVDCPEHEAAARFVASEGQRSDVMISEWAFVELYNLLRNPAVFRKPLSAAAAVEVVQTYRAHPRWGVVSFPPAGEVIHETLWALAAAPAFPRRRVFDARMALCLCDCGVTELATANVDDFQGFGFARVWNPLLEARG